MVNTIVVITTVFVIMIIIIFIIIAVTRIGVIFTVIVSVISLTWVKSCHQYMTSWPVGGEIASPTSDYH